MSIRLIKMSICNIYSMKRRIKKQLPYIVVVILLGIVYFGGIGNIFGSVKDPLEGISKQEIKDALQLKRQVFLLKSLLKRHNVPENEYSDSLLPTIYVITPTYARPHQKAELTRLKSVFLHIQALHWILIEDADEKSELVSKFLETSKLSYTHLHKPTPSEWKLRNHDPSWYKPRGVLQRNAGITWLHQKFSNNKNIKGVVYFADDDNTYSIELFEEMRWTKQVSVWPVGLVGGVLVERPKVVQQNDRHQVTGWLAGWKPDRPFATDMAGFAINLSLLLQNPNAKFSHDSKRGYLESDLLEKMITRAQLEPKADLCTKVYVWHTRTEKPKLTDEVRLQKLGKATNPGIEV